MIDALVRFLIGGSVVSAFGTLGGVFKPTSFAGLFGAAPSIALATLALAVSKDGKIYVSTECRSMVVGAIALGVYSLVVSLLLAKLRMSALKASLSSMGLWLLTAFALWRILLR